MSFVELKLESVVCCVWGWYLYLLSGGSLYFECMLGVISSTGCFAWVRTREPKPMSLRCFFRNRFLHGRPLETGHFTVLMSHFGHYSTLRLFITTSSWGRSVLSSLGQGSFCFAALLYCIFFNVLLSWSLLGMVRWDKSTYIKRLTFQFFFFFLYETRQYLLTY